MSYLIKQNQRPYFRIHIPNDLKSYFKCHEIQRCLGECDMRTANDISLSLAKKVKHTFHVIRQRQVLGLSQDAITNMVSNLYSNELPCIRTGVIQDKTKTYYLSKMIKLFQQSKRYVLREKSYETYEFMLGVFLQVIGDKPIDKITRDDCKLYRDVLTRLPVKLNKKYKGQSIKQIAAKSYSKMLSPKTINNHLISVNALLNWCVVEQYIQSNPCRGLFIQINRKQSIERDKFSSKELEKLFNSKSYVFEGSKYWVPLIAVYSGCRMTEILQLYIADIKQLDGIWCFDINDNEEDKKLKNIHSQRLVPIHPCLIKWGLLRYIEQIKQTGAKRLWNDVQLYRGSYSYTFSKWFSRYKSSLGIDNPKLTFHSFRHNFIDCLKQNDIAESYIKELVGHTDNSITMERYGKRYNIKKLYEIIQNIGLLGGWDM